MPGNAHHLQNPQNSPMPAGFEGFEGLRLHDSPLCQSPWVCTVAAGRERSPPHNESARHPSCRHRQAYLQTRGVASGWPKLPYDMEDDATGRFAHARIIGGKSAWIESEINNFLAGLPLRRYKSDLSPDAEGDKKAPTHDPESKK